MTSKALLDEAMKLDVDERLDLLDGIWASLGSQADELPLSDEQRQDLQSRLKEHEQNPEAGMTWDEVKARLRSSK